MEIAAKDVMTLRRKTGAGMMDCKKALKETGGDLDAAVKWLREKGMAAAKKRADRVAGEGRVAVRVGEDHLHGAMVEVNSETDFVARNAEFIKLVDHLADWALANGGEAAVDGLIPVEAFDLSELKHLAGRIGENLQLNRAGFLRFPAPAYVDSYVHPGDQLGVLVALGGDEAALASGAARELAHDLALQIAAAGPHYVRRDDVPADVVEREMEIYKTQMRNEGKPEAILDKIAAGKLNKFYEEFCLLEQEYVKESKTKVSSRVARAGEEAGGELRVLAFLRFKVGEASRG